MVAVQPKEIAAFVAAPVAAVTIVQFTVSNRTRGIIAASKKAAARLGKGEKARAGLWDTPAGTATRSQPPPIARAVDFARDRRFEHLHCVADGCLVMKSPKAYLYVYFVLRLALPCRKE